MRPLDGIRVIEFCSVAAGPFCAMLLADMGADVIKVENPDGGDSMRQWPPLNQGYSENFASLNRNKRSVTLDLKEARDNRRARDLIRSAQAVIENNRPGVMQRLNLDYQTVSADDPQLVYCSISAFGQSGARSREAGFDLTLQAMSGIMSVTGEAGQAPVKCGVPVSDFSTGLYGAFAIASALFHVRAGGSGTHIDASMLGCVARSERSANQRIFWQRSQPSAAWFCPSAQRPLSGPSRERWIFCDGGWQQCALPLCLRRDQSARSFRRSSLRLDCFARQEPERSSPNTGAGVSSYTCSDLLARFRAWGVPCSPINTYSDALADPQVEAMGWVHTLSLPPGVQTRTFGSPLRFSDQDFPIYRRPQSLGEHNTEVFTEIEAAQA